MVHEKAAGYKSGLNFLAGVNLLDSRRSQVYTFVPGQ